MNNFEYYKVFYFVAKCNSLTAASKILNISQPAISQSIHNLEDALGVELFVRVSKGVRLTQEGEALFAYVSKGCEQLVMGEEIIRQMQCLEAGEITIGASDMTLQFYLLPYLEKFHEEYPKIKISVTNAPTPETIDNLMDRKIDFGVISSPFEQNKAITTIPVRDIEDVFVAARRFTGMKNKTLDLHELEKLPLICLEGRTSSRTYMDDFLKQNGMEVIPEFELATSDMIVQFALRNLGVGCVMKDFASKYIENGLLFELRFNTIIPKRHICLATLSERRLSTAAENFLKIIQKKETKR